MALVTGGAIRVGRLITEYLIHKYDAVLIIYHSSDEAAIELKNKYSDDQIKLFRCDLMDPVALKKVADLIFSKFSVELIINNASVMKDGSIMDTTHESLLSHYAIHLFAPILLSQYLMRCSGDHILDLHIINILDIKVYTNKTKRASYLLSKKSLKDFTKMAALEFSPHVRVNGIAIGWIYDPNGSVRSETEQSKYLDKIPLKRKVSEHDLLSTIDFLLDNTQLTGQIINLAGGSELKTG